MTYTKSVSVQRFNSIYWDFFREKLCELSQLAGIGVYSETTEQNGFSIIRIDMWSDNEGSVNDFVASFLEPLAEAPDKRAIESQALFYRKRLWEHYFYENLAKEIDRVKELNLSRIDAYIVTDGVSRSDPFDLGTAIYQALRYYEDNVHHQWAKKKIIGIRYGALGRRHHVVTIELNYPT